MRISLIEYAVFNYPIGMEGNRFYRIEYGGHAQDCLAEGTIWLPPHVNQEDVEEWLMKLFDDTEVICITAS